MKTKTSKQPKQSKLAVQLKDLEPRKEAKGSGTKLPSVTDLVVDRFEGRH